MFSLGCGIVLSFIGALSESKTILVVGYLCILPSLAVIFLAIYEIIIETLNDIFSLYKPQDMKTFDEKPSTTQS
ncbi:MAG: hypothetical protein C0617_03165 [Desulfuromonas sp.]|uniref:hypothetical protein n=1 Tax=Desulfuromonas sp. TaxID=892 RepID=UPI000CAAD37E|nr:hypothetical protein [Desulfuromonas sp.]PLX85696.1 MAG: hypothetical protein C0617_03165 [Desulfuromonas sp.]